VTAANLVVLASRTRRPEEPRELCVVISCHQLVCALPARTIERLVLPDEVTILAPDPETPRTHSWDIALVGEERYAACNLGALLAVPPLEAAWVLLRVRHKGGLVPIALQTGPCLIVQKLGAGVPLPSGAFRARSGAITSVFPTTLLANRGVAADVGLWLDPSHLWVESELDAAAGALAEAGVS